MLAPLERGHALAPAELELVAASGELLLAAGQQVLALADPVPPPVESLFLGKDDLDLPRHPLLAETVRACTHFSLDDTRPAGRLLLLISGPAGADTSSVNRKRLLLVITLAETGGAQTYTAQLLPALTGTYEVTVAAHGHGPLEDAAAAAGARFVPLRHVRRPIRPRDLAGLVELVRLFRRERPDIVHLNSSKAGLLGRIAGLVARVPVRVFTVHGWSFSPHHGLSAGAYRALERLLAPLAWTICVSEGDRAAAPWLNGRAVVIRNAVDASAMPPAHPNGGPPTLVAVGRLVLPKSFWTLADALRLLPADSFRALVAGDGPQRTFLEGIPGVELLGERHDVPALLAQSHVFVLSSRSEGMPISVLEAMAAGLPVVASSVGGIPEQVVDGETGLLVPPDNPAALACALQCLLDEPELRARMGAAGRRRAVELFDVARFRRDHLALYERLLASP
jgi:glycosyltransferase involved in cell wall biosynthesis